MLQNNICDSFLDTTMWFYPFIGAKFCGPFLQGYKSTCLLAPLRWKFSLIFKKWSENKTCNDIEVFQNMLT
jgi:hypothetical protein